MTRMSASIACLRDVAMWHMKRKNWTDMDEIVKSDQIDKVRILRTFKNNEINIRDFLCEWLQNNPNFQHRTLTLVWQRLSFSALEES